MYKGLQMTPNEFSRRIRLIEFGTWAIPSHSVSYSKTAEPDYERSLVKLETIIGLAEDCKEHLKNFGVDTSKTTETRIIEMTKELEATPSARLEFKKLKDNLPAADYENLESVFLSVRALHRKHCKGDL
jgi:hypothetical protein